MKKFKNHQRPRRKYRFDIVGHKKALKIWWDSPFKLKPSQAHRWEEGFYHLRFQAGGPMDFITCTTAKVFSGPG